MGDMTDKEFRFVHRRIVGWEGAYGFSADYFFYKNSRKLRKIFNKYKESNNG